MTAYKPPKIDVGSSFTYVNGRAVVQVDGKAVKVIFEPAVKDGWGDKERFKVSIDDAPEWLKRRDNGWKGTLALTVNEDRNQVLGVRPYQGMYSVRVKEFTHAEGESPTPKTREVQGKAGQKGWKYEYFTVILQIVEGEEAGMEIPYTLRFSQNDTSFYMPFPTTIKGKEVEVLGHPISKSKYMSQLEEFEDVTGLWKKGPIAYQDNPLPIIEKRILGENQKFKIVMKNGWIDTIYQELQDDFGSDLEDDEEADNDLGKAEDKEAEQLEFSDGAEFDEAEPEDEELPWEDEENSEEDEEFSEFE